MGMFKRLFANENRMASTYKPVFVRSLLDIGKLHDGGRAVGDRWVKVSDQEVEVDLNFIAARFAKYYWDMEYSFRLRQSQDRQDANIARIIRAIHDPKKKPPTLRSLASRGMEGLRKDVIRRSLKPEVLVHLKTDMGGLYEKRGPDTIVLDRGVIGFFAEHEVLLRRGLNSMIAKYLEKINEHTPKIAHKVEGEVARRRALNSAIRKELGLRQDGLCFYCGGRLAVRHVDHVIPFNFVFSTDPHNCVLACQRCNCTKSDCLPHEDIFGRVLERNEEIRGYLQDLNSHYAEKSYRRTFESCIEDYHTGEFFVPAGRG